jgi:hypothetical protein
MRTTGFLVCSRCEGEGRTASDGDSGEPYKGCENCDSTGRGWLYRTPFRALGLIAIANFVLWEWGLGVVHWIFR